MTVALPLDEKPDIVLRQPSVGRLAASLRRARRERRFVTVILNARVEGMELDYRGRFSWLSKSGSPRRFAKRVLAQMAKGRGADVAAVKSAVTPEHVRYSTALKALDAMLADPCVWTNRSVVWTDGIAYWVQIWSSKFRIGAEHLPGIASDQWWAVAEFDHHRLLQLRDSYGPKLLGAFRALRAMVRERSRGGLLLLAEQCLDDDTPLRWDDVDDKTRKQLEGRLQRLRAPAGDPEAVQDKARRMLMGERVSMTRALKEDPNDAGSNRGNSPDA